MADEIDEAIDQVLEGKPRASEIAQMLDALRVRRESFVRERDRAPDPARRREWETRLRELDRHIAVLREEEAITQFVENSVRATVNRPQSDIPVDDLDDFGETA